MRKVKCRWCEQEYEVGEWDKRVRRTCGNYDCKKADNKERAKKNYIKLKAEHFEEFLINLDKKCVICGIEYIAKKKDCKYCSDACRRRADAGYSKKYYAKNKKREVLKVKCRNCLQEFETTRHKQEFCLKEECRRKAASYYSNRCMKKKPGKQRIMGNARSSVHRKLDKKPCLVCGRKKNVHAHHHNYKNRLDVNYLCAKHHKEIHSWDAF